MKLPQYNMFLQCINEPFEVHSDSGVSTEVVLRKVTASDQGQSDKNQQANSSFSLIFEGKMGNFFPQGMHKFFHAQLGEFEIFIVPIGPENHSSQMRYEAIFN